MMPCSSDLEDLKHGNALTHAECAQSRTGVALRHQYAAFGDHARIGGGIQCELSAAAQTSTFEPSTSKLISG